MSEPCEKCGADISYQGEHHTNCDEVVLMRGLLRSFCNEKGFSCDCGIADETWERVQNAAPQARKDKDVQWATSPAAAAPDVPLCDICAEAWFTERDHLKGNLHCIVCAFLGNQK